MKPFNYQQRVAVLRILQDVIYADGRIDIRETELFEKLKQELCITEQIQEDVQSRSTLLALCQVRALDAEQKSYLVELMRSMIVVDEDIDSHEVLVYDLVCNVIGSERLPLRTWLDVQEEEASNLTL
ncbi:hypothetical protein [Porphyromonas sp.]